MIPGRPAYESKTRNFVWRFFAGS